MTDLLSLFSIGFLYSLYHCVGMCGGFVMAYSAACGVGEARAGAWRMHLLFNLGRVTSYSVIGAALGFAGSWVNYYGRLQGPRLQGIAGIVGGMLMILFGLSLSGILKMPSGGLIGGKAVRRSYQRLLRSRSVWRTFPMGMLIGTIPCGLVYSVSSYALASGAAWRGALDMAAFGCGTIPAMFCFGYVSSALSAGVRRWLLRLAVVLTIIMGIEAIRRGLTALVAHR